MRTLRLSGANPVTNASVIHVDRRRFLGTGALAAAAVASAAPRRPANPHPHPLNSRGARPIHVSRSTSKCGLAANRAWKRSKPPRILDFPLLSFGLTKTSRSKKPPNCLKNASSAVSQFTAWGFGTELNNPAADHEDFRTKIEESCDVAAQLDCSLFTVEVGNDIPGVSKADRHAAAIRDLKKVAPLCERRNKTEVNFRRVFEEIKRLGYPGFVGLECTPLQDDLSAARSIYEADNWS